jgi:ribose 5-phosphate isomerase A
VADPPSSARQAAAAAAAELVAPGSLVGLGSGRAVWATIELLPEGTRAVVASELTRGVAERAGVEVLELDGTFELELALDGADEVAPDLGLIKGGGGALLREKIVISAARSFVVVAEASKKVDRLGEGFKLPVEVVRFAWQDTQRRLGTLLPDAELRVSPGTSDAYVTDEGHYILDATIPPEADAAALAHALDAIPGVVDHGLFLGMASVALLGRDDGTVERLERG